MAKIPKTLAKTIKRTFPAILLFRPLDFLLWPNLTILSTKKAITPSVMRNAPNGDGNTPMPNNNINRDVNVKGLRSSESEGTSALAVASGVSLIASPWTES